MMINPKQINWLQPVEREDGTPLDISEIRGNNIYISPFPEKNYELMFTATLQDADRIPSYTFPVEFTTLDEGQYNMVITTVDTDGRESRYSEAIQFEVQIQAPKPPTGINLY
jgi:hypothetical protein